MLWSCTAGSDRVAFVYVPGGSTLGAFAAFLRDDDARFRRLGQNRIRYCSTSPDVARKARGLCYRRYQTTGMAMHPAVTRPGDPVVRRDGLLHFEARRRFESRASHTFSQGGSTDSVRTSSASQGTGGTRGISGGASMATRRSRPTGHPGWSRPEPLQSNASKSVWATPTRCLEAPMRRNGRNVRAPSNGPWPGPLPTTHRATRRAGWRALVSRIQGPSSSTFRGSLPPSPCRGGGPRDSERRPCRSTCQSACRSTCRSATTSRTRLICFCISRETGAGDW
jgi:hypothetical protein